MTDKTLRNKVRSLVGNGATGSVKNPGAFNPNKYQPMPSVKKGQKVKSKGDAKFRRFTFDQRQAFRARRNRTWESNSPWSPSGPTGGRPNTGKTPPYPGKR